jgi:hypothetical protein
MKHLLIVFALSVSALAQFQNAELTAPDGQAGDNFGYSVSVSGKVLAAVVLAQNSNGQGIVYLFQKSSTGWNKAVELAELTASDGVEFESVSISGSVVVAGAPSAMVNGTQQGAAYVFVEPPGGWTNTTETARLTSSDGFFNDVFGESVAINGKTIVVGAGGAGVNFRQGEAYVYVQPLSGWTTATETARLTPSDGEMFDTFGFSVAINGYRIAVGAPEAHGHTGKAYVFQEPLGGWVDMTQTAELTNSAGFAGETLGSSVAALAGTVVAGAPGGAKAYLFVEPPTGWVNTSTPTATLTSSGSAGRRLGYSVAINTQMIVAGDPGAKTGFRQYNGGAFAYREPASGWQNATETAKLFPKAGSAAGWSIAAELNSKVFLGSPDTTVGQNQNQGAVFVMTVAK